MKWIMRIFVGILVVIVLLWAIVRITTRYHDAEDLEKVFLENEEEFRIAAAKLSEILLRNDNNGINISTKNYYAEPYREGLFVEQIGTLYFITTNSPYPQEEYINIYDAVAVLISSLDLYAIAAGPDAICFCASLSYGIDCDIFYTADGESPRVDHTIKDQVKICDGWYAVITHD